MTHNQRHNRCDNLHNYYLRQDSVNYLISTICNKTIIEKIHHKVDPYELPGDENDRPIANDFQRAEDWMYLDDELTEIF